MTDPFQRITGRIKQVRISSELLLELMLDGFTGRYRVEGGVPETAKMIWGYYDEPYVGASGVFVMIVEDESFEQYDGTLGNVPYLYPMFHSLSETS